MTDRKELEPEELDRLLEMVADDPPEVPDDLFARILADADDVLDQAEAATAAPRSARDGLLERWMRAIGGWPALAGLGAATLAGVWIGYAPPSGLEDMADAYLSAGSTYELGDFMPLTGALESEG